MARRRHALPGDRSSWSDIRRIELERSRRSFEAAAHAAQQDPHRPDQDWLISYFRDLWNTKRAGYARRRACDIAIYLTDHHCAELMDHPEIATILFCPDHQDPMSFDLEGSIAASRRARLIGDGAFASATMENYAIYSKRYVRHCKSLGFDHLDVQPHVVEDWLALLGH